MLDKHIDPDDYPECPECGHELEVTGDKWEGERKCHNCGYEDGWDNIPVPDDWI